MGKSAQKNPPEKSPANSSRNYTTKIPDTFLQRGRANNFLGLSWEWVGVKFVYVSPLCEKGNTLTKFPGNIRKMQGQSGTIPDNPGQSREIFIYAFSCLSFFSGPLSGPLNRNWRYHLIDVGNRPKTVSGCTGSSTEPQCVFWRSPWSSRPIVCVPKGTHRFFFAELTEFATELSEFSLPKKSTL